MFGPADPPKGPFRLQMALPPFGCDPNAYTVRIKVRLLVDGWSLWCMSFFFFRLKTNNIAEFVVEACCRQCCSYISFLGYSGCNFAWWWLLFWNKGYKCRETGGKSGEFR